MQRLPEPFAPFAAYPQFIGYRLVWDEQRNKMQKKPVHCFTGRVHSPVDPAAWGTFEQAAAIPGADGVGFVFTENDPFWFLDIDDALMPDGQWSQLAQTLCAAFAGCAVEVSQSGQGLHIFGSGPVPPHSCDRDDLKIQFYTRDRFVALTGSGAVGNAAHNPGQPVLDWLVSEFFPLREGTAAAGAEWTDGPCDEWNGYEDDGELLEAALRAVSAASIFGADRATFADLWSGDAEALSRAFPDSGRDYNASQADAALALRLMFWTGRDCERTKQLMLLSGLVRDKWLDRSDYLERTILAAAAVCSEVHQRPRVETPAAVAQSDPDTPTTNQGQLVTGYRLLAPDQQLEYFAGCVYVIDRHAVFTPSGQMLDPPRFKSTYGGYSFAADSEARRVTRNAWEAFTEGQGVTFPKVARTQFRPDLPAGLIFESKGVSLVNNYVDPRVPKIEGDPSLFLDHLNRLLPDERDRQILLAYMAACVQHKGVKFQWCPLIQGVEGNGKTLLSRVVAEAVGMQYVHTPKPDQISNNFNSWIRDKLFIYVEDVYYPDHKREVIEALKPIITNDWQPVEPKGQDQSTDYVVANLMLNSNHRDAIRKTRNDRRFAVFYTAQQEYADLARSGMDGDYFPRLYGWLKDQNGYAVVTHFLETYEIPEEFNPAGACHRAPETSSTRDALVEGLGGIEQEILEAIDEGRPGFAGGWVSSMALDRLLHAHRAARAVPPNKRRDLMRELGYEYHPGLRDGRVNSPIPLDGGKPRLFIKNGHVSANLVGAQAIAAAYVKAQEAEVNPTGVQFGANNY